MVKRSTIEKIRLNAKSWKMIKNLNSYKFN